MAADTGLVSNADIVAASLVATESAMRKHMRGALRQMSTHFETTFKRSQFGGYTGRAKARSMQNRTGALRNSLKRGRVTGTTLNDLEVRLQIGGSLVPYAAIHEHGGVIKPRRARVLRIPSPDILTPTGVVKAKYQIRIGPALGGGWMTKGGAPTFIGRSKKDNKPYIAIREGKRGRLKVLYFLRPSVTIKPRLGYFRTWREQAGIRQVILKKHLKRAVAEATSG